MKSNVRTGPDRVPGRHVSWWSSQGVLHPPECGMSSVRGHLRSCPLCSRLSSTHASPWYSYQTYPAKILNIIHCTTTQCYDIYWTFAEETKTRIIDVSIYIYWSTLPINYEYLYEVQLSIFKCKVKTIWLTKSVYFWSCPYLLFHYISLIRMKWI